MEPERTSQLWAHCRCTKAQSKLFEKKTTLLKILFHINLRLLGYCSVVEAVLQASLIL